MILVYSYDKACKILDLFSANQIIALKIYLDSSLGKDKAKYVFDYKTYEDYPAEEVINIRSYFNEKNLQIVTQATKMLNEFVTMMELNNVDSFGLDFNIITKEFNYFKSYKKQSDKIETPNKNESYQEFIIKFEKFITQNGVHKINIPGLYEKNSGGKQQRGAKYNPINFGQLISKLKDVIVDDGNS